MVNKSSNKVVKSAFSVEQPEDSSGFLLWQTTTVWQREIRQQLDKYDISHAQFVVMAITLWFTEHQQDVTQVLIAKQSKLDKMTVSKALKKLAASDVVTRVENIKDPRAKSVTLTKKGEELAVELVKVVDVVDKKFFSAMDKIKQKEFNATLYQLIADK